jgi:hypothetical protein
LKVKEKKAAIDLTELALGVIVLGIVVSIGATILINFRDSRLTSTSTYSINNETAASVTEAGVTLNQAYFQSTIAVTNATGGEVIPTSNYTLVADASGFPTISVAGSLYNNSNLNVSYNYYNVSEPQYALPDDAAGGLAEYGNWFTILVIVGVAAVVLSLIFLAFGRRGAAEGGEGVSF